MGLLHHVAFLILIFVEPQHCLPHSCTTLQASPTCSFGLMDMGDVSLWLGFAFLTIRDTVSTFSLLACHIFSLEQCAYKSFAQFWLLSVIFVVIFWIYTFTKPMISKYFSHSMGVLSPRDCVLWLTECFHVWHVPVCFVLCLVGGPAKSHCAVQRRAVLPSAPSQQICSFYSLILFMVTSGKEYKIRILFHCFIECLLMQLSFTCCFYVCRFAELTYLGIFMNKPWARWIQASFLFSLGTLFLPWWVGLGLVWLSWTRGSWEQASILWSWS